MTGKPKLTVAILFGGKSAEHEVSLQSAKNVYAYIDKKKFTPILIGISKNGEWLLENDSQFLLNEKNPKLIALNKTGESVALIPQSNGAITNLSNPLVKKSIDVVFPVLHGPFGEDGTVQGLLKLANIPFVGPSVLGSAVGMDKDVMKRLLRDAGIPIADFIVLKKGESQSFTDVTKKLGLPLFIKPANLGSSVGVSKVTNEKEYTKAIEEAFLFDRKIIIEEFVDGREIECAVLGNDHPQASIPGEVTSTHDFYSYEAKYIDENGATVMIPASITDKEKKKIQEMAIKTFTTLCCEGLGRVDSFLTKNGKVLVNEINTIPGFTAISMYPKLWQASGISYTDLITKLIELAVSRFNEEKKLQTSYI